MERGCKIKFAGLIAKKKMNVKNPKNRQEEIKEEFKWRQLAARFCAMKEDYERKLG